MFGTNELITMKKRIISGILANALAIVIFIGTDIETVDKAIRTAMITASSTGLHVAVSV